MPGGAVDIPARVQKVACDDAVATEQQDEREGLDDGRRNQRKGGYRVEKPLARHGGAGETIGKQEGQHRGDDHGHHGYEHAVVKGAEDPGFGEIIHIVLKGEHPVLEETQPADVHHRIEQENGQDDQQKRHDHAGEEVVGGEPGGGLSFRKVRQGSFSPSSFRKYPKGLGRTVDINLIPLLQVALLETPFR